MPMLRKDPIAGRWVIVAPERTERPRDVEPCSTDTDDGLCPFCAEHQESTPEALASYPPLREDQPWSVRIVPNKFPALSRRDEAHGEAESSGLYEARQGVGAHDVIIESPTHVTNLAELSAPHIGQVMRAWRDRVAATRQHDDIECAVVFKNHGAAAGASLEHTHSQLIALPIVPKRLAEELIGAKRYFLARDACVFCDLLEEEIAQDSRMVALNEHAAVIAPFASRFPFELWVLPRAHQPSFEESSDETLDGVARVLRAALNKLNRALEYPPYNLMLHSAPFLEKDGVEHYHWHLELIPTLTQVAGFEWGTGFYINPTAPESAAEHLRQIDH